MIDELELKILCAKGHFLSGWSLWSAMSRAGFTANWTDKKHIREHPLVLEMKKENNDRNYEKRMFKLKV